MVQVGNVQSTNVEAAVPTELQTLLNCFTTTGCFRQCLPPGGRICHYKNAVLYGCTKGQKLALTYTFLGSSAKL